MKVRIEKLKELDEKGLEIFKEIHCELFKHEGIWKWRGFHFDNQLQARRHLIEVASRLAEKDKK